MSKNASRRMLALFPLLVGFACPAAAAADARVSETYGKLPLHFEANRVPTYAQVRCANLCPGIDLIYYGNQRQLEYDFVVHPGADPNRIVLAFQGAARLEVDEQGDLVLHTVGGPIRQRKPAIYQEVHGA